MFTGCSDGVLRAYDAWKGHLKKAYYGHIGALNCMTLVGTKIFTGSNDSTVRVWNIKDISEKILLNELAQNDAQEDENEE